MIRSITILTVFLFQAHSTAFAYFENYPPYTFKEGPPKHLEAKPLVGLNEKYEKDGITVSLKDGENGYRLSIRDGKKVVLDRSSGEFPRPQEVYRADLNGDSLQDFIIISWWGGAGLGSHEDRVELLLKKKNGTYAKIQYETMAAGLQDFVGPYKNGQYDVIMTAVYQGLTHNYFSYRLFQIKNYRLLEAKNAKGFPKYVWMTDKPNDKDTTHLTVKERRMDITAFQKDIVYS